MSKYIGLVNRLVAAGYPHKSAMLVVVKSFGLSTTEWRDLAQLTKQLTA